MLKQLDKYMDNLKSPYWEIYLFIGVAILGIAGIVIIFIDPKGLASKLGNAGSFIGGLIAFMAFILAAHEYLKYTRNRGQNEQVNLAINLLPKFKSKNNNFFYRIKLIINVTLKIEDSWPHINTSKSKSILSSAEVLNDELNASLESVKLEYKIFITKSEYLKSESYMEYINFIDKVSMLQFALYKYILILKDLSSKTYGYTEPMYEDMDNIFISLVKETYKIENNVTPPALCNSSEHHDQLTQWKLDLDNVTDDFIEALNHN